ncbi:CHAP domain-containing protein [Patescibacteria group bacterium]
MTKRLIMSCLVFLFVFIFGLTPVFSDSLDQKQEELDSINQQISKYENAIATKQAEIGSLKNQIGLMDSQIKKLELEIQATDLEIEKNQAEINKVAKEIKVKEKEIKRQKKIVGRLVLLMYQREQTGVLEIILESNDFSDFLDQLTYLEVIENQGQEAINYLKELKGELDAQKKVLQKKKKELTKLKQKQISQKKDLLSQRGTKDRLLARTEGEEAVYQEMLGDSYDTASQVQRDIAAIIRDRTGAGPHGGYGTGGYPWHGMHGVDPWGFYMGQCTSYAAWKWSTIGRTVTWRGNANAWAGNASAQGYQVDQVPEPGSIICWTSLSFYGHVGHVESVNGSNVTFTDYNGWGGSESFGWGTINYRDGQWGEIYFIH